MHPGRTPSPTTPRSLPGKGPSTPRSSAASRVPALSTRRSAKRDSSSSNPHMTAAATYEVKPPSAILAEDVICQSFIQSSSTLAYACLLIRGGKYDLAAHVLHSLEAKPASRFKDMVFYLQAQIGIETGDYAA